VIADLMMGAYLVHFAQDRAESRRQCVALFGEQRMSSLCTLETSFGVGECHARREDRFSWASARHDGK